ncbi:MAG: hypothetical protein ACTSYG_10810 [Candidatus Heimdallarchaeota archaeon]
MGQINLTIALVMIGLFTVALLGFAINFASDNDAEISLSDDPELSSLYTKTGGNLSGFDEGAESSYASIVETTIAEGGQTTASGGQFAITPTNVIGVVKNIIKVGYIKIFGTGSGFGIFLTTFLGLLVFVIGLYIWKTWAGRAPD